MQKTSTSLKAALFAAMGALAFDPLESPFRTMPAKRYARTKYAEARPANNTAGSKLARKAAEKRLTGNIVGQYGRGLLNHFAGRRRTHSLV